MKSFYANSLKVSFIILTGVLLLVSHPTSVSACTPLGDQTTYGANNTWIGYVYQGKSFNTYKGYVNEGTTGSPNFDESFGGSQVNYNTNGCPVYTDTFSVRYKLTQNFTSANYSITVGGDDGYRLSLDGGATWAISNFVDHSYTTTTYTVALSGSTNMVLEYYENMGGNRVSFNITQICTGTGDPSVYGTGNLWNGYIYQGTNFDMYKGQVSEGLTSNPGFDENFGNPGGGTVTYNTSSCSVQTANFSARYRLTQTLTYANYVFTVGGDDGYRLSLDGGSTWVINNWNAQAYTTTSYTAHLSGTVNMVLEYFQNGGYDRLSFAMTSTTLPVTLVTWSVSALPADQAQLKWETTNAVDFDHFTIQRSSDGEVFEDIHTTPAVTGSSLQDYSYTDPAGYDGTRYYRLVMTDKDGAISYSPIISIALANKQGARIYPTVVEGGNLFIESAKTITQARLELYDMSGRLMNAKNWAVLDGRQQVSLTGSMPAGAYIARLTDGHSILAKQIILIR